MKDRNASSIIERLINDRKFRDRARRVLALLAVVVLLLTTDSLKMLASTLEFDPEPEAVAMPEFVDPEETQPDEGIPVVPVDVEEFVSVEAEGADDDPALEEAFGDAQVESLGEELYADELNDVGLDEVLDGSTAVDDSQWLEYGDPEPIAEAQYIGNGLTVTVSGDSGVTLPAGTSVVAQWMESAEERSVAEGAVCAALSMGERLADNMGGAFLDISLLNEGYEILPEGNVYVNIDLDNAIAIHGEQPGFRVLQVEPYGAVALSGEDYGVTQDANGNVTGFWYYANHVSDAALVWETRIEEPADEAEYNNEETQIVSGGEAAETVVTDPEDAQPEQAEQSAEEQEQIEAVADQNAEEDEHGEDEATEENPAGETVDGTVEQTEEENAEEPASEAAEQAEDGIIEETGDEEAEQAEVEVTEVEDAEYITDEDNGDDEQSPASAQTLTGSANGVNVALTGDVPAEAEVSVRFALDDATREAAVAAVAGLTGEVAENLRALPFDVILTYNNEEIQPGGPVTVTVSLDAPIAVESDARDYGVARIAEEAAARVDGASIDAEGSALAGFSFTADSISGLAVYYAVGEAPEEPQALEEPEEETLEPLQLGIATITTAEGEGLPASAEGHAQIVPGEDAIAALQQWKSAPRMMMKKAAPKMAMSAAAVEDDAQEPSDETAAPQTVTETRYLVFDIDTTAISETGYRVELDLSQNPVEGRDFHLYHIHDGVAPIDAELTAEEIGENGAQRLTGLSFITPDFSLFVLEYTVEVAVEQGGEGGEDEGVTIDVTLDFENFQEAAEAYDADEVFAALDEGVSIDLARLFAGEEDAESEVDEAEEAIAARLRGMRVAVDQQILDAVDLGALEQVSAEGGVSYDAGRLAIVDNGAVTLTDGTNTLHIAVVGYAEVVEEIRMLVGEGVTIEVLEGDVPETAVPVYAALEPEEADALAEQYIEETEETVGVAKGYAAFDVSILDGDAEFTEAGQYRVTVTPDMDVEGLVPRGAQPGEVAYRLYHIHDGEATELHADVEDGTLTFTTDSFSDFIVTYTVDFHYAVDGETYEYELTGGGALSLRALVEALRVLDGAAEPAEDVEDVEDVEAVAPDYDAFVANIESVTFSDEALVKPVPVTEDATAGELKAQYALEPEYSAELTEAQIAELDAQAFQAPDWALMSLKPFATDEALTITMAAGEVFTVRVTDAQIKKTVIDAKGDTWEITVTYGDDAQIPGDAELYAAEILPEDEHYDAYYQQASEVALGDAESQGLLEPVVAGARLFDIEIRSGEEKIEPAAPVQVDIKLLGEASDLMSVVHFAEEGPEAMALTSADTAGAAPEAAGEAAEPAEAGEEAGEAATEEAAEPATVSEVGFKAQAFSVYSVVNVNNNTDIVNGGPYALVSGIAHDPGATTGWWESDWNSTDYYTIIANANAMTDAVPTNNSIGATSVHAWSEGSNNYVGGDVAQWYFESAGNNTYIMYVIVDGTKYYLDQWGDNQDNVNLSANKDWATKVSVTPNSDGTVSIHNGNWYLHNDGESAASEWQSRYYKMQYNPTNNQKGSAAYRFRLCKKSDAFDSFAARKKAAKDLTSEDNFIIYRKFVDEDGSEQLYALASDGSFVRVYDGGDTVYWRETDKNIYWNYLKDGTYYSIFTTDPVTHDYVYLNPMDSTHQTITAEASRLTLIGKDNGEYGTAIENWDQTAYDYAGLHVTLNNGEPTLGTGTRVAGTSDEFLFAVYSTMPGATAEPVETVDSEALGIHITVYDYGSDTTEYTAGTKLDSMTNVAGSAEYTPHAAHALVKPYLESDLPSSKTKGAMTGLFTANGSAVTYSQDQVTKLFLKSYYDENGMFRYRSEDNFAYLGKGGNTEYTVYRQAATPYTTDTAPGHTYYYHGHYMPFNQIDMTQHVGRLMNQYGNDYDPTSQTAYGELPIGDGRSYEEIYGTQGIPNFYTGMKMEATFSQPKDGKLENGDDMIFKFTGDDDMWVYIDGVLVLDVGGIHEPLTGTINFRTGEVTNPTGSSLAGTKTLYQIFQDVLNASGTPQSVKDKINTIQWKDVNDDGTPDTFADYTNHDFKSFYMERGAGASNLDLQFNLKVTLTDEFTVKKELPDGVDPRFINQTYKFRATFKDNGQEKPLFKNATNSNNDVVCTKVYYKDRKDENGRPIEVEVPVDENGYFYLKAGEAAVFKMADDGITYNVYEVFDADLNQGVEINGTDKTPKEGGQPVDGNAAAGEALVRDRTDVNVLNQPFLQRLDITKHIIDTATPTDILSQHEGYTPGVGEVFEFRVYLESTVEVDGGTEQQLIPYAYAPYYVTKMVDGQKHYYKLTGENNAPVDQGTTPVVCSTTGRSGSINSIPPEYTVEIPNLAAGTHFYLEERRDNIPAGFAYDHEELENGTYDDATIENINRIIARDEKDHQEFDPKTVGRIKKDVDAESHVYNRKVNVHTEKQWLKQDGTTAYTLEEARQLPGATGAVITAELWKVKTSGEPTTVEDEPVTVTFWVNTTTDSTYRQVGGVQTIKKGSTLEFSLGARGTSKAEAISANPEIEIVRTNATSSEKIRYTNGREKDKWSKYTISNIQADTIVYATFDASKVGDDFVGLYIASMEAPGSTVEPVAAKVADIRLVDGNDWRSVDYPAEEGYTYELRNVQETGLPNNGRYAFNGTPVITTDEHGNITLAVSNTYREPIEVTVEKVWQPPLSGDAENSAWVDVELHRYVKATKGTFTVELKTEEGSPIEGATFTLYKDGEVFLENLTTDEKGQISQTGLEPGTYYYKQVDTPDAYDMAGCTTQTPGWEVKADQITSQTHKEELTNKARKAVGAVTLTLVDQVDDSIKISGATFDLYKGNDLYLSGLTTDGNGQISQGNLEAGMYRFVQTGYASGYKHNVVSFDPATFTVDAAIVGTTQEKTVTATNTKIAKGSATVTLTRKDNGSPISGAQFDLLQNGAVVQTATTDGNGQLSFTNLGAGEYVIKQTSTSDGLGLAENQPFEIEDNGRDDQTNDFTLTNDVKNGKITVELYRTQGSTVGYGQNSGGNKKEDDWKQLKPGTTITVKITRVQSGHDMYYCTDYRGNGYGTWKKIEDNEWNGNDYYLNYTIPSSPEEATYRLGVSSTWGLESGTVAFQNKPESGVGTNSVAMTARFAAPRLAKAAPALLGAGNDGGDSQDSGSGNATVIHADADPLAAPEEYVDDTGFEVQTGTLRHTNDPQTDWRYVFEDLEKYDPDGNEYVYYVVEKDRTPSEYWVDKYERDEATGTITITNKKVNNGTVRVTKAFSGIDSLPDGFRITNDYNDEIFTVGNATGTDPYTWEIQDVPNGTVVTFTETGIQVDDYDLTVNATATAGESATVTATAVADSTVTAELVNEYTKKKGSLIVNKQVLKNGQTDTSDTGTYYFAVYAAEDVTPATEAVDDTPASPATPIAGKTPVYTGSVQVTGGEGTVTVPDLTYGDYYVFELTGQNGTPIASGEDGVFQQIGSAVYKVTGSGTEATVGAQTPEFTLTNAQETVTATILKQWEHGSNNNLPAELKVTLSNGTEVTLNELNHWTARIDDLPKYDSQGSEIEYSWTEGELPSGYYLSGVEETNADGVISTTLTNSYTDTYNPMTTIKGKKIWNDEGNPDRPKSIKVKLYKDGDKSAPYRTVTVQAPTGEGANQDQWPFEFTNLPVFNEDGSLVQYTVEEVPVEGYTNVYGVNVEFSQATYVPGEVTGTIVNSGEGSQTFKITDGVNLGYIVIRHGNDFIIWTPRPATDDEIDDIKDKVSELSDQFNGIKSASGSSMKIITGVPRTVDVGKKQAVSVYMQGDEVWMKFLNPNAWSDFAYGTIAYTYTPAGGEGGGTITNTRKVTEVTGTKTWKDSASHTNATDVVLKLTRTWTTTENDTTTTHTETATVADSALTWVETPAADAELYQPNTWNEGSFTYSNLPKYTDETMTTQYEYRVVEAKFKVGESWYTVTESEGAFTVTDAEGTVVKTYKVSQTGNDIVNEGTVDIEATKTWKNADGTDITATITHASVALKLQQSTDGENWTDVVPVTEGEENPQTITAEGEALAAWKASWTNLPKYVEGTDTLIRYKVVETAATVQGESVLAESAPEKVIVDAAEDYTVETGHNDKATDGVENTLPTVQIDVTKSWTVDETEDADWPEEVASVTVGLYQKSGTMEAPEAVMADETTPKTATIEKPGTEAASFTDLPKYDAAGNPITYSVQETAVTLNVGGTTVTLVNSDPAEGEFLITDLYGDPDNGDVSEYDETGVATAAVTNTKDLTELTARKVWSEDSPSDHPESVEFQVYRVGSYTVTEEVEGEQTEVQKPASEGWYPDSATKYTITGSDVKTVTDLPAKGIELIGGTPRLVTYEYTVIEVPVEGSTNYLAEYDEQEDNHFTITNTPVGEIEHQTQLDVTKNWVDLTPDAQAHDGDEITFKVTQKIINTNHVPVIVIYQNGDGSEYTRKELFVEKGASLNFTFEKGSTLYSHPIVVTKTVGGRNTNAETGGRDTVYTYTTGALTQKTLVTVRLGFNHWLWGHDEWGESMEDLGTRYRWKATEAASSGTLYTDYDSFKAAVMTDEAKAAATDGMTQTYTLTRDALDPSGEDDAKFHGEPGEDPWTAQFSELDEFQAVGGNYLLYFYEVSELSIKHGGTEETVSDNQTSSYTVEVADGTITNTEKPVTLQGTKKWIDDVAAGEEGTRPENLVITLYKGAAGEGNEVTLIETGSEGDTEEHASEPHITWTRPEDSNVWTYTITNLPRFDAEGARITYIVKETVPEGYRAQSDTASAGAEADGVIPMDELVNIQLTTAEAEKEWLQADGETPLADLPAGTQIKLKLSRYKDETLDDTFDPIEVTLDGTAEDEAAQIGQTGVFGQEKADWKYLWSRLDKYYAQSKSVTQPDAETGEDVTTTVTELKAYTYKVEETSVKVGEGEEQAVANGMTADGSFLVSTDGMKVTNTENVTSIHVDKKWFENGSEVENPTLDDLDSITIQLWRKNGAAVQLDAETGKLPAGGATAKTATLTRKADPDNPGKYIWSWDIDGLQQYYWDETTGTRKEYVYYVVEEPADGWSVSYSNDVTAAEPAEGDDEAQQSEPAAVNPAQDQPTGDSAAVLGEGRITLKNSKYSVSLPHTGGRGTGAFYATGAGLLTLAALWFIWDQRRRYREEP